MSRPIAIGEGAADSINVAPFASAQIVSSANFCSGSQIVGSSQGLTANKGVSLRGPKIGAFEGLLASLRQGRWCPRQAIIERHFGLFPSDQFPARSAQKRLPEMNLSAQRLHSDLDDDFPIYNQ